MQILFRLHNEMESGHDPGMFAKRIAALAATIFFVLLAIVRGVLELIGYATIPDDAKVAAVHLEKIFTFVLDTPWWGVYGVALLVTVYLIYTSWPSQKDSARKKVSKYESLGGDCVSMSYRIHDALNPTYSSGPVTPQHSLVSDVFSLSVTLKKSKIDFPDGLKLNLPAVMSGVEMYLAAVGRLLLDGHLKEAKAQAEALGAVVKATSDALPLPQLPPNTGQRTRR